MRFRWTSAVFVLGIVAVLTASSANGDLVTVYNGCYTCVSISVSSFCETPANNSWGDGSTCTESSGSVTTCQTSGGMCYYTEVGSGTGGGGGGGWDSCGYTGGFCPAECFSCGGSYY